MSDDLQNVLRSLCDVDGVVGSFVIDAEGAVAARDLPEYFDGGALSEVGPRIERLYEAWKSAGSDLDSASLVYRDHKLHLRELGGGYLAVVSSLEVNAPALRMAMGMVGRRVSARLEARAGLSSTVAATGRPAETRPSAAPPAPHGRPSRPQPESDGPKPRMYRGSIVR